MELEDTSKTVTSVVVKRKGYKLNSNSNDDDNNSGYSDDNASVKSSREKTPMCLVNDLARYNKILFQYRLTGEKGPAHCKQFTVTLELGDEVYTAEGFKIKKAQHLAAKEAIQKTKYKHPVPKVNRRTEEQGTNVTPTVELNAIAMKLGQQTYYILDPKEMDMTENGGTTIAGGHETMHLQRHRVGGQMMGNNGHIKSLLMSEYTHIQSHQSYRGTFVPNVLSNPAFLRMYHGHYHNRPRFPPCYPMEAPPQHINVPPVVPLPPCKITLIVGTQKFYGVGRTIQQAKHDAAAQAIVKLKEQMIAGEQNESSSGGEKQDENGHKSPISLVFEIGIKRNLPVDFKILRVEGPAHMRKFITACVVGEIMTQGEGTGKKASKKKAAQKMIEELNKLPPLSPVNVPTKRVKAKTPSKKPMTSPMKSKNTPNTMQKNHPEKYQKSESEYDYPVAKMLEWCQDNNYPEPVFRVLAERGKDRSRRGQFVIEVKSNDYTAQGSGNSKKIAKRNAAQNFLLAVASNASQGNSNAKEFVDKNGQNDVPTIMGERLSSNNKTSCEESHIRILKKPEVIENVVTTTSTLDVTTPKVLPNESSSSMGDNNSNKKVINSNETINTVEKSQEPTATISVKSKRFHMKDKLMYLAKLIGFEVDFSDYPKGNHNEFLTILMISTNPPQICHGVGINAEESQEDASKNALKILSEMGLNNSMK